jgi:hypothetical protein
MRLVRGIDRLIQNRHGVQVLRLDRHVDVGEVELRAGAAGDAERERQRLLAKWRPVKRDQY